MNAQRYMVIYEIMQNIATFRCTRDFPDIPSSTFFVTGDAYILPYRLHTYLGLNSNGSPYYILVVYDY